MTGPVYLGRWLFGPNFAKARAMMRTIPLPLLLSALSTTSAQPGMELIRNGGFESVDRSVTTYDQLTAATGWSNATLALSEVFDPKASVKTVGIPENDYGYMKPFEGERYAGFCGWKDDVRRNWGAVDERDTFKPGWNAYSEYLQSELVQPLRKGVEYELAFRVALSQNSDRAIIGLGAIFHENEQRHQHRKFIDEIPEVFSEEMITEKGKWHEVRGTFKADGKERWIIIGIYPYVGMESRPVVEGPDNRYAYFYIDGVSLTEYVPKKEGTDAPEGQ